MKKQLLYSAMLLLVLALTAPHESAMAETSYEGSFEVAMKHGSGMNPCMKNPCMKNPCMKNPCMKNPCMKNPCSNVSSDIEPLRDSKFKNRKKAVKLGKKLWKSKKLGTSGQSCATCHGGGDGLGFDKPFPHYVSMADDVVTLDQMINFCVINPLKGEPLKWNSKEMTALAAYYNHLSVQSGATGKNPCMKNPCAKNPCAKNPCAKNPCMKNPCGR